MRGEIEAFFSGGGSERWSGASFPRKVWFLGRWITHGDWYPDRKLRLVRREGARWGGSPEHDYLEVVGPVLACRGDLHHYSFPDMERYVMKINVFAGEYLLRLWSAGEDPRYRGWAGRIRYMARPLPLADLAARVCADRKPSAAGQAAETSQAMASGSDAPM
jgi:hypothetical protein